MQVRMLAKDNTSGETGCPAAYLGDNGEMIVQAPEVDADTMGNLVNLLPGETAVRIDPQVIVDAAQRYVESQLARAANGSIPVEEITTRPGYDTVLEEQETLL